MSGHNIAPRQKKSEVEGRGEVGVRDKEQNKKKTKNQAEWAHSSDMRKAWLS